MYWPQGPVTRSMYLRRLRTLTDHFHGTGRLAEVLRLPFNGSERTDAENHPCFCFPFERMISQVF